ncbi:3-methyl-2-oxobutanoate hydroxymethyltransferase [Streptomyces sp. WAC 06725]|uniref:isocitrate lyase/PEP mutase family protein n=1 Tax=Streptomyces sp. WAC 06725 TaxID=2203209 RepID=UPI000F749190|nr:isocitrate lyase/phosphoenolpyruvate mutase family protein [Streptomyces sp. WAC 06725]RSO34907.1 3-methyl-2-oxobutanoate hydroxymethyltransferase [Streptomyces sp. WAC 06725]
MTHTAIPYEPTANPALLAKARAFRALHDSARQHGAPLVLPNAWDTASARLIEDAGAPAVATTSAGAAWGLGTADGDRLGRDRALELIARIAAAVRVPVTADIEGGYGDGPEEVAETVRGVLAAGAVGVNIEDATHGGTAPLRPAPEQAARLAAARRAADAAGVPLFLNARIDTYLTAAGPDEEARLKDTLERASVYVEAGADGIFVPGAVRPGTVRALAEGIAAPLNVMAGPGAPSVAELGALGVARVSVGAGIAQAAHALVREAAREILTAGTYATLAGGLEYGELNSLFGRG